MRLLRDEWRGHFGDQAFVDVMLPASDRLHVVLDGISRGFVAVKARSVVDSAHIPSVLLEGRPEGRLAGGR
jgi:pilus assembly protein CpaF